MPIALDENTRMRIDSGSVCLLVDSQTCRRSASSKTITDYSQENLFAASIKPTCAALFFPNTKQWPSNIQQTMKSRMPEGTALAVVDQSNHYIPIIWVFSLKMPRRGRFHQHTCLVDVHRPRCQLSVFQLLRASVACGMCEITHIRLDVLPNPKCLGKATSSFILRWCAFSVPPGYPAHPPRLLPACPPFPAHGPPEAIAVSCSAWVSSRKIFSVILATLPKLCQVYYWPCPVLQR